jgi:6-pyruvoyltetrahydropterin/6-carboxytetrahydropterin synthase
MMPQPPRFHVRLCDDRLVFSAGHFITFEGGQCERVHGHNYRVSAEVQGPLGPGRYVVDFGALRRRLRAILDELDHRMLLPGQHGQIRVAEKGAETEVTLADRRWVFPRQECLLLPLENTTAELLADWIGARLWEESTKLTGRPPERLRIEIEESPGCWAVCELTGD